MPTLDFKGKSFVYNHHLAVKYHQLIPESELSLTDNISLHDNLIIHGDNLKALKALLPTYAGKIKCIYIDPPYNTGNEKWIYNDNVNSPMLKEWLGKVVDKEDLTRHDKWLCMMFPRLKLLRELLSEDGVIFISIDDNEQHVLRSIMDEIFGDYNFITNIIWQKKFSPQNDSNYFSDMHDFIVCYAKNKNIGDVTYGWERILLPRTEEMTERYQNPDNDPRGPWSSSDLSVKTYSATYDYEIVTPSGRIIKPTKGRCWRTSKEKLKELINENRIWFGENGDGVPRIKRFLSDVQDGLVPVTIWLHQDVGHNQQARQEIKAIFDDVDFPFETPKPVSLIKRIIQLSCKQNDIILDSFAGSGTTAQAVLELNNSDNGNRKFILVEMEDYADSITAERVRRVIKGKQKDGELFNNGLGGTFSFFNLGNPIEMESILQGGNLPSYMDLARYVFFTATGEQFNPNKLNEKNCFIGETKDFEVYLYYKPDIEYLKKTALTLDAAESLGTYKGKKRLVFAPAKYVDTHSLLELKIEFCQLPFEIYKLRD